MRACELCGASNPEFLLGSERLDGPLVRCRRCRLVYVGSRSRDYTFSGMDPERSRSLAERVEALGIVDHGVEDAEAPWRRLVHERRLERVARHAAGGRLLEVGCASGEFLEIAAAAGFEVEGLEPDPGTSAGARERAGLPVRTGTLDDAAYPPGSFDVVVLWHVLEHLDSPRRAIEEARRILRPGGVLGVETPAIDTLWFRVLRSRWRQLIPDHYFFFGRETLTRLIEGEGFQLLELEKVGRPMSLRFAADRVRRIHPGLGAVARRTVSALGAEERTVTVNLGDIMLALARAPGAPA
jgi:2-polyprenyl-3-methyl-5-hydroxy-6-metoxy-1,4-benzoquinol methylase